MVAAKMCLPHEENEKRKSCKNLFKTKNDDDKNLFLQGSGCGSLGSAVACETKGPHFKSSHWQVFIEDIYLLSTVLKRQK